MAVGLNTITRSVAPKSIFESAKNVISSTTSFLQGDLLIFDTSTKVLRVAATEAEGATFCGVARLSISLGKPVSPYQGTAVDAAQAIVDIPGPTYGVVAKCIILTGDSVNPGDNIFLSPGVGTRGVASTGTKAIGTYEGPAIAGAAALTQIEVLLGARYPNDTLKF